MRERERERERESDGRRRSWAAVVAAALVAGGLAGVAVGPIGPVAASSPTDPIDTMFGIGVPGYDGDGFSATRAQVAFPSALAMDAAGNLLVVDGAGQRLRKVATSGIVTTIAGTGRVPNGTEPFEGDALQLPLSTFAGGRATSIAVDSAGNILIGDATHVRRINPGTGAISVVAGSTLSGELGDGGPATSAVLGIIISVAVGPAGDIFILDGGLIRRIDTSGIIHAYAGYGTGGDGDPAVDASLSAAAAIAVGPDGLLYIAEEGSGRIRRVDAAGIISTVYGTTQGYGGDNGPAALAQMQPTSLGFDGAGNLYVGERSNASVRKIDTAGIITTVAGLGNGLYGDDSTGDGGAANAAPIAVWGLAVGADSSLFIGSERGRVRRAGPERLVLTESRSLDRPKVDDKVIHTFTVKNYSATSSTNVKISDAWTSEEAFLTASKACKGQSRSVSCSLGTLAPGASASVTVAVQGVQAGAGRHTATVTSNEVDPNGRTNTLAFPVRVSAKACGLNVSKDKKLPFDIGPCADTGVTVTADNVTLDLGGKRVYGFPGISGPVGNQAGIFVKDRHGVTVKNGAVSGFDAGVAVVGGGSNTVTGVVAEDNVGPDDPFNSRFGDGIFIEDSTANVVRSNTVRRNGIFDGIGIFGANANDNLIESNLVEGNIGPGDGGPAGQGIIVNGAINAPTATTLANTRILDNVVRGNYSAGISNINHLHGLVADNVVEGNGFRNGNGNGIALQAGARWNRNTLMETVVRSNEVHGNGADGIQIKRRAGGNHILNNNAADNLGWDLNDQNGGCFLNEWNGNVWGSGGFSQDCTTAGGSQAPASSFAISSAELVSPAKSRPALSRDAQGDEKVLPPRKR